MIGYDEPRREKGDEDRWDDRFGEISRERAVDLAARARSIAEDVNQVCGQERCIGSLSLAVLLLSQAVQAFLVGRFGEIAPPFEGVKGE